MELLKKIGRFLIRGSDWINGLCAEICAWVLGLIVLIIVTDVFLRYALSKPFSWGLDVTSAFLLAFGFFASGYVERDNAHIRIDLVTGKLNPKVRKVLFIIGNLFCAVLCGFFIFGGFGMVQHALTIGELSPMLIFPVAPIRMLFVAGFFLWGLSLITGIFKCISNKN